MRSLRSAFTGAGTSASGRQGLGPIQTLQRSHDVVGSHMKLGDANQTVDLRCGCRPGRNGSRMLGGVRKLSCSRLPFLCRLPESMACVPPPVRRLEDQEQRRLHQGDPDVHENEVVVVGIAHSFVGSPPPPDPPPSSPSTGPSPPGPWTTGPGCAGGCGCWSAMAGTKQSGQQDGENDAGDRPAEDVGMLPNHDCTSWLGMTTPGGGWTPSPLRAAHLACSARDAGGIVAFPSHSLRV